MHKTGSAILASVLLTGCGDSAPPFSLPEETPEIALHAYGPAPDREPGTCWGLETKPAVIETVTEQVLISDSGAAPVYQTETRQTIVEERQEIWFRTPCESEMTPDFIASLQRALYARGYLSGALDGVLDTRTRQAILKLQQAQGLDSDILSLEAARSLGLVAYGREVFAR